ncbi:unnamed protein product, partial [Prorocentrum cordatum]
MLRRRSRVGSGAPAQPGLATRLPAGRQRARRAARKGAPAPVQAQGPAREYLNQASPRQENDLELTVEDDLKSEYVFAVVRVAACPIVELASRVERNDVEGDLARVRALLASRPGAGAAGAGTSGGGGVECVGDERLQLRCPLTLSRPTSAPARGRLCRHLQCMDLDAYLVANVRTRAFNSRWRCPLCSLGLRAADLCIDTFVEGVLAATADGVEERSSWRPTPPGRRWSLRLDAAPL